MWEFFFGESWYVMAIDPITGVLLGLGAIPGIANLFKKPPRRPDRPDIPAIGSAPPGMSPEMEARFLKLMRDRIGTQKNKSIGDLRTRLGARGSMRSGLAEQLTNEIGIGADRDLESSILGFEANKMQQNQDWQRMLIGAHSGQYGSDLAGYRGDMNNYYNMMGASGEGIGDSLSNFLNLYNQGSAGRNSAGYRGK